jgi:hypothetical protein
MAGSLAHIVEEDGTLRLDLIENLRDAGEALEECFHVIRVLSEGSSERVNIVLGNLGYPKIAADMKEGA